MSLHSVAYARISLPGGRARLAACLAVSCDREATDSGAGETAACGCSTRAAAPALARSNTAI